NNWRQKKGMGQGKRDEWGGEYAEGGYRDVAGNFFPYGSGRSRKRTPGKGWQAWQEAKQAEERKSGKAKGKLRDDGWTAAMMSAVQDLAGRR
ncbi:unnamed protein product, partial [Durusdinium trenchii]